MSQTTATEPTIQLVRKASIDLHVDATPSYPEGLHPFPKNYTITLPADQLHPLKDVKPGQP